MPGDGVGEEIGHGGDLPQIPDEDKKKYKGEQEAVIDLLQRPCVKTEDERKDADERDPPVKDAKHRKQAEKEAGAVKRGEKDAALFLPLRLYRGQACLRLRRLLRCARKRTGGKSEAADHEQNERKQRIREDRAEEGADLHGIGGKEIDVLRVPDGRRHAAEVGGHRLQRDDGDDILSAVRRAQRFDGERDEGDERDVVGDEHGRKKAKQHRKEGKQARRPPPLQQFFRQRMQKAEAFPSGDHRHQAKKKAERAEIDIFKICGRGRDKARRDYRQKQRYEQDDLCFQKFKNSFHNSPSLAVSALL